MTRPKIDAVGLGVGLKQPVNHMLRSHLVVPRFFTLMLPSLRPPHFLIETPSSPPWPPTTTSPLSFPLLAWVCLRSCVLGVVAAKKGVLTPVNVGALSKVRSSPLLLSSTLTLPISTFQRTVHGVVWGHDA